MARMTEFQPLYDAFHIFQERCLQQDHSLLWPEQSFWTLSNLERWKTQVIDHPNISGDLNFNEKLQQQLASAPRYSGVLQLTSTTYIICRPAILPYLLALATLVGQRCKLDWRYRLTKTQYGVHIKMVSPLLHRSITSATPNFIYWLCSHYASRKSTMPFRP